MLVAIESLEMSRGLLDEGMKARLSALVTDRSDTEPFEKFAPSELDALFTLVKTLQVKVVKGDGDILVNATARDLASLIGGITSLLRAFSTQQQRVDEAKELGDLKSAVLAAIRSLTTEAQERFYIELESHA